MPDQPVIMVVEDEKVISNFLGAALQTQGYKVIEVATGKEAISLSASHCPDLILLDLGLPDIDGMVVLESIRQWTETPIIVVSAREHEREKVEALDNGADDYVTKPFSNDELLARVRTALRHSHASKAGSATGGSQPPFLAGQLRIDYTRRQVSLAGKTVHLTPIEYRILTLLSAQAGKVITHETLLKELWGPYANDNQILRVNMANIRRKLEENPADPRYILTEVGVGYRMVEGDEPAEEDA